LSGDEAHELLSVALGEAEAPAAANHAESKP
jgi:hypothetical protein